MVDLPRQILAVASASVNREQRSSGVATLPTSEQPGREQVAASEGVGFCRLSPGPRPRRGRNEREETRIRALIATIAVALIVAAGALGSTRSLRLEVSSLRSATWTWQDVMQRPRTPTNYAERRTSSRPYLRWLVRVWAARSRTAQRRALRPPHYSAWLCLHRHEGSWTDPGAPYYGGLQMDLAFQRAHGRRLLDRKGTADNWTPLEQMWVAEDAHRSRGFGPWPNTRRYCRI